NDSCRHQRPAPVLSGLRTRTLDRRTASLATATRYDHPAPGQLLMTPARPLIFVAAMPAHGGCNLPSRQSPQTIPRAAGANFCASQTPPFAFTQPTFPDRIVQHDLARP